MTDLRLLDLRGLDPYTFQGAREAVFNAVERGDVPATLALMQPAGYVVSIGMGSDIGGVDLAFCEEHDIAVMRAPIPHGTAGGFYTPDVVRCTFIASHRFFPEREVFMRWCWQAVTLAVQCLGVEVYHPEGSNNLIVSERKVSLASTKETDKARMFSCGLTLRLDFDLAEAAISSPKSMRQWVGGLCELAGREITVSELFECVRSSFEGVLCSKFTEGNLSEREQADLRELARAYRERERGRS